MCVQCLVWSFCVSPDQVSVCVCRAQSQNSWGKNANIASYCDCILFNTATVGLKQTFQQCSQLSRFWGLWKSSCLPDRKIKGRWWYFHKPSERHYMALGEIITSPGFQFNFWLKSCALGRGQDEPTTWKYREAEEASSEMCSSLKNLSHLSLWCSKFRAGDERRQKAKGSVW